MKHAIRVGLTTLLLASTIVTVRAMAEGDSASGQPPAVKVNPTPEEDDGYWTPERLREAKPIEMPHPDTPPEEWEHDVPPPVDETGSVGGAGSPGGGDVPPDESRYIIPEEAETGDEPAAGER